MEAGRQQGENREGEAALAAQNSVLTHIARPYASALFDLAQSENQLAQVETGLSDISRLIGESEDFSRYLRSPVITADVKASALNAIIDKAQVNPLVANFLKLVAKNGRLFALDQIIVGFRELAATARGEMTAEVTSAAPLSEAQASALAETLKAKLGKTVTLNQFVDPSLIGGLQVKVGSQMIDSSLKTKLAAMKIAMKEVG
ncbi:F0F1 ATP synthase subunit delta [Devosia sp. PTR5]|uniref:ATP synthase subunit delta n=1 Tax=Devosia oryzisoli TaxID=2774138 RepID=A0A927IUE6_9HYPH|nr:F0F1 ATP synthase subunit delta [Devosia oryzisoli]